MQLSRVALATLGILLLEHCTTVTLTRWTQQRVDAPRAEPTVAVLFTEVLKLLMSVALELTRCGGLGTAASPASLRRQVAACETARLALPALLYTLQNNLIYVALGHLEVVSFQVLYQTKLIITAVLSVAFLGRRLTASQWLDVVLLTAGVVAVELSDASAAASSPGSAAGLSLRSLGRQGVGALAALSAAAFSSIAGVYFEGLVKARETTAPSLWARNVQLCVFTIPLAAFGAAMKLRQSPHAPVAAAFTAGFDAPTVLLVVLNASGGLLVAAVIKYGDNILKNFTTSCSVILGTLISIVLFDFRPTLQFGWGSAIVIGAAYLYAVGGSASAPAVEKEADAARRLLEESEAGSPEGSRADSRRSSIESV